VSGGFLFAAAFLASTVEMVEALTIVLAVGVSRGWRSALVGVGAATVALAVIVAALGTALTLVPIGLLRLVIGWLLLVFGLQWLRKAILRAGGLVPTHDEEAIYAAELEQARLAGMRRRAGLDWYAFTISFKGVFLEGMEVAFIVVSFGGRKGGIPIAAAAAGAALLAVASLGLAVRAPLARVPENTLKFVVGVMLTGFGTFWSAEGAGVSWPGEDLALPVVLAFVLLVSLALVQALRWMPGRARSAPAVVAEGER
jgi:uncharacterized membrane protein